MRFAQAQSLLLFTAALLAALPLLLSNEIGLAFQLTFIVAWCVGWFVGPNAAGRTLYRRTITGVLLAIALLQIARIFIGIPMAMAVMELASALLSAKLLSRTHASDDRQIALLAFLHLIAGTAATDALLFGACFLGFTACTPPALAMIHLRQEMEGRFGSGSKQQDGGRALSRLFRSKRIITPGFLFGTSLLSIPVLVLTVLLFVLFPRLGFGFLGRLRHPENITGFGDTLSLGKDDLKNLGDDVIIRVEPIRLGGGALPPRLPFRLRVSVMDRFDGVTWTRSEPRRLKPMPYDDLGYRFLRDDRNKRLPPDNQELEILADAMSPKILPVPEGATWIAPLSTADQRESYRRRALAIDRTGEVLYEDTAETGIRYRVGITDRGPPGEAPSDGAAVYHLYPGAAQLIRTAEQWAGSGSDVEKAMRLVRALKSGYRYELSPPKTPPSRALSRFLYTHKAGNCEHFATALTLMLRATGIPARLVAGFLGADLNPVGGFYAVRKRYAHAWTEAFIDGRWVTLDATPTGPGPSDSRGIGLWSQLIETLQMKWRKYVVGYDLGTQGKMAIDLLRHVQRLRNRSRAKAFRPSPIAIIGTGTSAALLAAIYLLIRRRRRNTPDASKPSFAENPAARKTAVDLGRALERRLAARGFPKPPHLTLGEHLHSLRRAPDLSWDEASALVHRYHEVRFGNRNFLPGERRALKQRIRKL